MTNVQLCSAFFSWTWCSRGWLQVTDTPSTVSASYSRRPGHEEGGRPRPQPRPLAGPDSPPGPRCCSAGTRPAAAPCRAPAPPARPPAPAAPPPAPAASTPAAPAPNAPSCRQPRTHTGQAWGREVSRLQRASTPQPTAGRCAGRGTDPRPGRGPSPPSLARRTPVASVDGPYALEPVRCQLVTRRGQGTPGCGRRWVHPLPLTWGRARRWRGRWAGCGAPRARHGPRPASVRAPGMSSGSRRPPGSGR